jgi:hypothetical protein
MSMKFTARMGALLAAMSVASLANAASTVSDTATFAPTTELITFNGYDGLIYSPLAYPSGLYLDNDGDVLFSSTANAVVGAFEQDLGGNGLWGARFDPTPTGDGNFLTATAPVLFNFGADGPQAQVGAFFNLYQAMEGSKTNSLTLTAYDQNMVALESFSYTVNTSFDSYNEGKFLGFSRTSADIYNFGISATPGSSIAMDNLGLTAAPVPEPESIAMLLAGLVAVGAVARRRRS